MTVDPYQLENKIDDVKYKDIKASLRKRLIEMIKEAENIDAVIED